MEDKLIKTKKINIRSIWCKIKNIIDIKNIRYNFFNTRYIALLFIIIIILKTILFYKNTVFYKENLWGYTVRQSFFFILIAIFPTFLFKKSKNRFKYLLAVDIIISMVLFADELYYGYANNILSVMQAGNLQYTNEIIDAIPSLLEAPSSGRPCPASIIMMESETGVEEVKTDFLLSEIKKEIIVKIIQQNKNKIFLPLTTNIKIT